MGSEEGKKYKTTNYPLLFSDIPLNVVCARVCVCVCVCVCKCPS